MDERIKTVLDYLEDHLAEDLALKELADFACLSVSQFHRLFKKETGMTPFKLIEELRISKAHQLILRGSTTVQDIALQLGYNDYETFSRAFKRHFYLSPDDLRSVVVKIRDDFKSGEVPELMFIPAEEGSSNEEIKAKLMEQLSRKGISPDKLPLSKAYKVERTDAKGKAISIHKKLLITSDKKLWNMLVNPARDE